jgi:toxin ParE1/3/4
VTSYRLSRQAQASLKGIYAYSIETFGKRRADQYLKSIRQKFRDLPDTLGVSIRDDINPGYLSIRIESHVIFFRINDNQVEILDILHRRMDPNEHL